MCRPEYLNELTAVGLSATFTTELKFTGGSLLTGYSERDDVLQADVSLGMLQQQTDSHFTTTVKWMT